VTWLEDAARTPVAEVADRLGAEVRRAPSADHCACPACGSERRHPSRRDRRGAVGISHARPSCWRCHECGAGGDSVDYVSHALGGARFRDLAGERRRDVREWFERETSACRAAFYRPPAQPVRPLYPDAGEVRELWAACVPVVGHEPTASYLTFRGIDPRAVAERNLARALPAMRLPDWARLGARPWTETGHRLIVPMYDAHGAMRSVLARSIERSPTLKSAAPRGFSRSGLVLANALGRGMLEHARAPRWWPAGQPFEALIAEGEIDHIASAVRADRKHGPAVLAVVSGSWTGEHAARIPHGSHVVVATDADEQGDKYAALISATLDGRASTTRKRDAA
jgi:hypothetical protein